MAMFSFLYFEYRKIQISKLGKARTKNRDAAYMEYVRSDFL